jgi:hypothetical protein
VDDVTLAAFSDELEKIAGIKDWWRSFLDLFKSKGQDDKTQRRVDYHFSSKAGPDKWNKFIRNAQDPKFVEQIAKHDQADPKLIQHAKSMHDLMKGTTTGKIKSSRLPGRTYEIHKIPGGLGCTCPDWRYKGSVTPGYECKHIKAHKAGKVKA